jgi:hypothetical protein
MSPSSVVICVRAIDVASFGATNGRRNASTGRMMRATSVPESPAGRPSGASEWQRAPPSAIRSCDGRLEGLPTRLPRRRRLPLLERAEAVLD